MLVSKISSLFLSLIVVTKFQTAVSSFDETRFISLVNKLKSDAFEFAAQVERLYENRCSPETMSSCSEANYGECQADYPNQQCLAGPNYIIDACSSGEENSCSALWDLSVSNVRYPKSDAMGIFGNPTDPKLIESICFSRYLDDWFVNKRDSDRDYWQSLGVEPRSMYYGSNSGAFRIFPARESEQCGEYDPRVRPWFVAGSSGPKNVVLILDVSGSMINGNRIGVLKEAAKRVVSTLTVSDRVLIVPFSDTANPISEDGYVFKATVENKLKLSSYIDRLTAGGSTNFHDGFLKAFDILENSIKQEFTADCNNAILFLTDGENTNGPALEDVTALVDQRINAISTLTKKEVLLFTYSVSDNTDVHAYPKSLACSLERGVWSKIIESEGIVDALSSYYQLFALGLGTDANSDFSAWVEPYQFATGNVRGTTVSVPVYDRSKTPHLFLGVVGVDVSLDALDAALTLQQDNGAPSATAQQLRDESIKRIVQVSDASCPKELDLSPCEMEAYRALSAPNEEGVCGVNCTGIEVSQVQEDKCPTVSDYPSNLFVHLSTDIRTYEERVCCLVGDTEPSSVCWLGEEDDDPQIGLILGCSLGGLAVLAICFWYWRNCWISPSPRSRRRAKDKNHDSSTMIPPGESSSGSKDEKKSVYSGLAPMPPPMAPHFEEQASAPDQ